MAINETNKVLTVYQADVSGEKRALDDLIKKIDQLKAKETDAANSREQHFDQLVLDLTRANHGVDDAAMSWEGLHKKSGAFSNALGGISSGIASVGKAMTPLNQGLELAGKAVRAVTAGLDEYAKTSATAATEVRKLKNEFDGYRDAVMAGAGQIAVELLKPAMSFDEIRKSMIRMQSTDLYKRIYGGGDVGMWGDNEAGDPIGQLTTSLGQIKNAATALWQRDAWNTNTAEDALGRIKSKLDETRKAMAALRPTVSQLTNVGVTDYDFDTLDRKPIASTGILGTEAFQNYKGFAVDERKLLDQINGGMDLRSVGEQYDAFNAQQSQSRLAEMFGPLEEFNAYATAFDMLGGAVTTAMDAWIDGSVSAGEAVKRFLADALKGLASQMAIESLKHGAYAIGSLAFGDVRGAGQHAAAAAAFGIGAAAAGVAAASLGTSASVAAGAAAPSAGAGGGVASGGGSTGGPRNERPIIFVVGNSFGHMDVRQRQLEAEKTAREAYGATGSSDS